MHIDVPLNKLRFGQEDGAGINARVAGRLDGIEALAANLHANGQIEDLIVKKFDGDLYAVSNGNRRAPCSPPASRKRTRRPRSPSSRSPT
jgi:ParB family chromosome partitioning protein